jgi:hypothetical protein
VRAPLLLAGAGGVVVLVGLLGTAGAFTGLAAIVIGAGWSAPGAPHGEGEGLNWWGLLAAGAGLCLLGVPLGLATETVGGLLAAVGAGLAVIGAIFGWPAGD